MRQCKSGCCQDIWRHFSPWHPYQLSSDLRNDRIWLLPNNAQWNEFTMKFRVKVTYVTPRSDVPSSWDFCEQKSGCQYSKWQQQQSVFPASHLKPSHWAHKPAASQRPHSWMISSIPLNLVFESLVGLWLLALLATTTTTTSCFSGLNHPTDNQTRSSQLSSVEWPVSTGWNWQ